MIKLFSFIYFFLLSQKARWCPSVLLVVQYLGEISTEITHTVLIDISAWYTYTNFDFRKVKKKLVYYLFLCVCVCERQRVYMCTSLFCTKCLKERKQWISTHVWQTVWKSDCVFWCMRVCDVTNMSHHALPCQ